MNMTADSKQVYAPAAEVVGMAMASMSDEDAGEVGREWLETYADNITKMLQTVKPDRFINCVWSMQCHHPAVVDRRVGLVRSITVMVHQIRCC